MKQYRCGCYRGTRWRYAPMCDVLTTKLKIWRYWPLDHLGECTGDNFGALTELQEWIDKRKDGMR
jgi:hypothetical protein